MENFADSVFGTLKKLRKQILPESDDSEEEVNPDCGVAAASEAVETSTFEQPVIPQLSTPEPAAPPENKPTRKVSPGYSNHQKAGKHSTLLSISQNPADGPNSEAGRRMRSMKLAHSMNSVYRKLHKDKNIHNDRHYLVSVAEHIKGDQPGPHPDS